jgi:hypothetical protein
MAAGHSLNASPGLQQTHPCEVSALKHIHLCWRVKHASSIILNYSIAIDQLLASLSPQHQPAGVDLVQDPTVLSAWCRVAADVVGHQDLEAGIGEYLVDGDAGVQREQLHALGQGGGDDRQAGADKDRAFIRRSAGGVLLGGKALS